MLKPAILLATLLVATTAISVNAIPSDNVLTPPIGAGSTLPASGRALNDSSNTGEATESKAVGMARSMSKSDKAAALKRLGRIPLEELSAESVAKAVGNKNVSRQILIENPVDPTSKINWGKVFKLVAELIAALLE